MENILICPNATTRPRVYFISVVKVLLPMLINVHFLPPVEVKVSASLNLTVIPTRYFVVLCY